MTAPCYKCPDREVGCHGKCEKYLAFRAECESRYQLRKDLAMLGSYAVESQKRQKAVVRHGRNER